MAPSLLAPAGPTVLSGELLYRGKKSVVTLASRPPGHPGGCEGGFVLKRYDSPKSANREFDIMHKHLHACSSVSVLREDRLLHDHEIAWRGEYFPSQDDGGGHPCNALMRFEPATGFFPEKADLTDADVARLMAPALRCVTDLHTHSRVVHCDIKPSNLVRTSDSTAVLIDFDCAAVLSPGEAGRENGVAWCRRGTPLYLSPETARYGCVGRASDVWALGVMLFSCCNGVLHPFSTVVDGFRDLPLKRFVKAQQDNNYSNSMWRRDQGGSTALARDLCRLMLAEEPEERISAAEALRHPLFSGVRGIRGTPAPEKN